MPTQQWVLELADAEGVKEIRLPDHFEFCATLCVQGERRSGVRFNGFDKHAMPDSRGAANLVVGKASLNVVPFSKTQLYGRVAERGAIATFETRHLTLEEIEKPRGATLVTTGGACLEDVDLSREFVAVCPKTNAPVYIPAVLSKVR